MIYRITQRIVIVLGVVLLAACSLTNITASSPSPTTSAAVSAAARTPNVPAATSSAAPSAAAATSSPSAAIATSSPSAAASGSGWTQVDGAMEARTMQLPAGKSMVPACIIRFDPKTYRVRVKYDPVKPGFLDEWNTSLKPLALINGGFFTENKRATGLVIFDGVARGESYQGFGGMVVINPGGQFELRSLRQQPYNPNEPLQQAMQSAPMLIQPGGVVSELDADTDRSRRSVIAQDRQGRVLLIAVDLPLMTLPELAQGLARSDLDLDAALALDGGRSTGLYLNTAQQRFAINSFAQVPLVILVERQNG